MRVAATFALAAVVAGCAGGSSPRAISGPAKEVAGVVSRLQHALSTRDFRTICRDLVTAALRDQTGGRECPRLMRERAGPLRDPRIRLLSIALARNGATAVVRTTAAGQAPIRDTLVLQRENGRLRIAALGRPG